MDRVWSHYRLLPEIQFTIFGPTISCYLDPMIGNFIVMPDSFLGLETGCPDADDYDNVTLTCTASKPSLVVPPLMVRWIRDSTDESQPQDDAALGSVTMNDDGTFVTNTLSFPTSMANDSATYVCYAALNISDSNIIMINGCSNVTFRGMYSNIVAW